LGRGCSLCKPRYLRCGHEDVNLCIGRTAAAGDRIVIIMAGDKETAPQQPEPEGGPEHPEWAVTIAYNIAMLESLSSVLSPHAEGGVTVEGRPCSTAPAILYVDKTTGRIEGVGSVVAIKRERREMSASAEPEVVAVEEAATGLPGELLSSLNTARVHVWRQHAIQYEEMEGLARRVVRPSSWPRNDRVILSEANLRRTPLEDLLPNADQRDVYLKSVEAYNSMPQSDIVRPWD